MLMKKIYMETGCILTQSITTYFSSENEMNRVVQLTQKKNAKNNHSYTVNIIEFSWDQEKQGN